MALIDKLTNIADAIRGKTGGTDPLTLDAMAEAIGNIETGGGGSSGGASGIYMAKVTLAETVNKFNVTHNLGTKDILFALCFAEDLEGLTPADRSIMANSWIDTNMTVRYGYNFGGGFLSYWTYDPANSRAQPVTPNSGSYWDVVVDENTFTFERGGVGSYMPGLTYTIIIMAKSAFSVTGV